MSGEGVGSVAKYGNIVSWEIPTASLLSQTEGFRIWSPVVYESSSPIYFHWYYEVPKGTIGLHFASRDFMGPPSKCVRFGVVDEAEAEINSCYGEWIIIRSDSFRPETGYFKVKRLCKLDIWNKSTRRKRIFCEVLNYENLQEGNTFTKKENFLALKGEKGITSSEDSSSKADESTNIDMENLERLSQNFKELYISGQDSDLTINVKDHEFKAHKVILRARSSVFNAMFSHELYESNSNIIPIEDCEPAVFEEFLFFVYSGRTRQLSSESAWELYYVADKYLMPELKEECIRFLKKSLSIETICDVICLSIKFNETELLDLAVTFFARNMEEILLTAKWQLFMKENPAEANELTIKALRLGFTKKKI